MEECAEVSKEVDSTFVSKVRSTPLPACAGAWRAKGRKRDPPHKIRKDADLNSHVVGQVHGGMKVNVVAETLVGKADGSSVHRLQIDMPKKGWITSKNFEHLKRAH